MFKWLLLLIIYLPFQIALNPRPAFDLASLRVFIVLLFIVWVRKIALSKSRAPKVLGLAGSRNLQSIGLFLFFILAGLSLIGAENIIWGLRKMVFFFSIFPLYFLVTALADNWLKIKKTIFVLISGAGLIALVGLGQFIASFIFGLEKTYEFWAWNIVPIFSGFNFGALILAYPSWLVNVNGQTILRAFSLFSDPHMFSFYLGLTLPLMVALLGVRARYLPNPKINLFFIIYCLSFIVLLLTFTRGAYFAIIVTFLVLAGLFWRYLKAKKIVLLLCFSLLIFIIPITPIADRFYSSFDMSDGSSIGRLEMWQQAGRTAMGHLWQGVGLGNYSLLVDPEFGYRNPITAHNLYLDILSEVGIFALIVWLVLILGTIWQLFWQIRITKGPDFNKDQTIMRIGLIGSLAYFSIHSFFETSIYHPPILALLMIILGLSTIVVNFKDYS